MRLLHSKTLKLQDFPKHEVVPYAILSHTWTDEEVLFQDIQGHNAGTTPPQIKQKLGYKKIEACCAQATRDGFDYVWIDTCCIDKSSSAELSEAINSMYRWYEDSAVCYAYLADVPNDVDLIIQHKKFCESRWFTRGWTLQELIAPITIEFYSSQWYSQGQEASLGTKRSLQNYISQATRIPINALQGLDSKSYSIAQKMSWASYRETTRVEDRAYCLLGLFNINMPLLYGEGTRAFIRLQEEILKVSIDESLFAWTPFAGIRHQKERSSSQLQGLLAMSPDYFADSGKIIQAAVATRTTPFAVTNRGLRLEVMLPKASDVCEVRFLELLGNPARDLNQTYVAVLNCQEEKSKKWVGILLDCVDVGEQKGTFVRVGKVSVLIDPRTYEPSENDRNTIFAMLAETSDPLASDIHEQKRRILWERQHRVVWVKTLPIDFRLAEVWPNKSWEKLEDGLQIRDFGCGPTVPYIAAALLFDNGSVAFVVVFGVFLGDFWIQLRNHFPGEPLGAGFRSLDPQYLYDRRSDRATHWLGSGKGVSASFRPQHVNNQLGYVVNISVHGINLD
jgi:hypothetical protein